MVAELIMEFLTAIGTASLVDGDKVRDFLLDLLNALNG